MAEDVENVVGVIVVIDGEIQTMDVFESTPLFRKLWPKLLKSYALDAANAATEGDPTACPREAAAAFLAEAFQAEVENSSTEKGIAITRRKSDRILSFSASDSDASGARGGFGGAFHTSAFSK